jgi:hypothetical protein
MVGEQQKFKQKDFPDCIFCEREEMCIAVWTAADA